MLKRTLKYKTAFFFLLALVGCTTVPSYKSLPAVVGPVPVAGGLEQQSKHNLIIGLQLSPDISSYMMQKSASTHVGSACNDVMWLGPSLTRAGINNLGVHFERVIPFTRLEFGTNFDLIANVSIIDFTWAASHTSDSVVAIHLRVELLDSNGNLIWQQSVIQHGQSDSYFGSGCYNNLPYHAGAVYRALENSLASSVLGMNQNLDLQNYLKTLEGRSKIRSLPEGTIDNMLNDVSIARYLTQNWSPAGPGRGIALGDESLQDREKGTTDVAGVFMANALVGGATGYAEGAGYITPEVANQLPQAQMQAGGMSPENAESVANLEQGGDVSQSGGGITSLTQGGMTGQTGGSSGGEFDCEQESKRIEELVRSIPKATGICQNDKLSYELNSKAAKLSRECSFVDIGGRPAAEYERAAKQAHDVMRHSCGDTPLAQTNQEKSDACARARLSLDEWKKKEKIGGRENRGAGAMALSAKQGVRQNCQ